MKHGGMWLGLALAAAGCSGEPTLEPCDVRETSCQRAVFLTVQDLRGGTFDPWTTAPPIRVISVEQYRRELEAEAAQQAAADPSFDALSAALKLFYLLDPQELPGSDTAFDVAFVAAYYDSRARAITLIDPGTATDRCTDVSKLGHELVHAEQDRDIDLRRFSERVDTLDQSQLVDTLIEGEAVLYEDQISARLQASADCELPGSVEDYVAGVRAAVAGSASPFRPATSLLRYPLGLRFLTAAYEGGGPLGVRRRFETPPDATVRFVADVDAQPAELPAWTCYPPSAPEGYSLYLEDQFGAYPTYAFATRLFSRGDEPEAWKLAGTWRNDSFSVFAGDEGRDTVAAVWSLRLSSEAQATLLADRIAASPVLSRSVQTKRAGAVLHLFASDRALEPAFSGWPSCDD